MAKRLLRKVIQRIRPSPQERAQERRFAARLIARISSVAPRGCRTVLSGSVAKGTFLRDSKDVDIFVLFPRDFGKDGLEEAIEGIVRSAFPGTGYRLSYAEHPYAKFHYEGRLVDLVPAYQIKDASERVSAVDRSVLHTKYVLKNMKEGQKGEVLLLKRFLKAGGLYGAEIKVEGFSGYLCELLILRYKSFMGLVSAASRWKPPELIDIKGLHGRPGKNARHALFERFGSRLVVIDPTDKDRNVAAALSSGNLERFMSIARGFRKRPSMQYFFRKPEEFEDVVGAMSRRGATYVVTFMRPDVVDDVLWGQLRKLMKQLCLRLIEDGFGFPVPGPGPAITADDSGGLVRIAFCVKKDSLPHKTLVAGPPLGMLKHVLAFMRVHRDAKFARKKGRIYAIVRRRIRTVGESVSAFFTYTARKGKSHLDHPVSFAKVEKRKKRPG